MRPRTLLALVLLPVALLGAAALLLPARIDWQARRAEIEEAAGGVLGRPVKLNEAFALRLLPAPSLSARGLSVPDIGDGFAVEAAEVRVALRFWPLLAGRVVATDIVLVAPRVRLAGISPPDFPARLAPGWIAQARVRIEDGTLLLAGYELRGIAAAISGEGPGGPFALDGEAMAGNRRLRVAARLARADAVGTAPFELTAATLGGPRAELEAVGLIDLPSLTFAGRARATAEDLSALLPAPALPAQVELGQVTASPAGIVVEDLRLSLGAASGADAPPRATASGAAMLRPAPARLELILVFPLLDLDPWLDPLGAAIGEEALPVLLDLTAAAASLRGGAVRDLRIQARLADGQAAIDQAAALLPGAASVTLSGAARRADGAVRFEGLATLEAEELRAGLAWLGWPTDWAAPGRLRAARGSAQVTLGAGLLQLAALDATVDGVRMAGGLVLNTQAPRASFGAGLTVEQVEPELWLAPALRTPAALAERLAAFDANLRLETPLLRMAGIEARGASLDATLEQGRLSVRRVAVADLAGARAVLAGAVALAPAPRLAELRLQLETDEAAGLVRLLEPPAGLAGLFAGPGVLRLSGQAAGDALGIEAEAELAGARAELRGSLDLGQPRLTGTLALRHPGARRLLAALAQPWLAEWVGDGSLSLLGQADLAPARMALSGFELVAGTVRGGGEVALVPGPVPAFSGRLAFEALDLPLPGRDAGPWPLAALRDARAELDLAVRRLGLGRTAVQGMEASLRLADQRLVLTRLSGQLAGGQLELAGALDLAGALPVAEATIAVSGATIAGPLSGAALDVAAGQAELRLRLAARGFGPAALLATLSGEGALAVRQGVLSGFDAAAATAALREPRSQPDALAALRAALAGGATAFDRLDGTLRIEAGSLQAEALTLAAEPGTARLSGTLDLVHETLDVAALLQPAGAEALPELGLRLSGPANAPRRVFDTAAAAAWLAERPPR